MRKTFLPVLTLFATLLFSITGFAQQRLFTDAGANQLLASAGNRVIVPTSYRASSLDVASMKSFLWSLPSEQLISNRNLSPVIELPLPEGGFARFHIWESSIMEPALAAKFPEMKTFAGQGIDDPFATVRIDYNPYFGFHAQVLSAAKGRFFIDPYSKWDIQNYISYYTRDNNPSMDFNCEVASDNNIQQIVNAGFCRGTELFTYRLALACTGEYAVAVCAPAAPTLSATAAAMLTTVNRVTGVYETEVSLRMVLIGNNDQLIYLDGTTDPYTNNNGGTMLGQNQANIDAIIGSANYDIGHVVSTGGGGVASLRVPCVNGSKARGVTGLSNPVGDNFDIDYVAHEMGHQWGGNHTFNSTTSSCGGGNRNGSTAYEVGSGTTIQAYAGICASDNTQPHSDPFFHSISFDEISTYLTTGNGNNCKVATGNGNILPVITSMNNNGVSIPISTPFTLSATATDANGDALTYCWEEWDLGPATTWNGGNANTTSPLFKSRVPIASGNRTFPDMAVILAGYPAAPAATMGGLKGETLPTQARAMKFRLTVRDNRAGGGGVVTGGNGCQPGFDGTFQVNTILTSGPFAVTVPNGGETFFVGSTQTFTWNVVETNQAPINVSNVKISLSTDGGLTYPIVLIASTPNDGSEPITIPSNVTSSARIKVEAIGNIFFDISDNNFNIIIPLPGFDFNNPAAATATCPAPASMAVTLGTISNSGFANPITLSASGNPAGTTVSISPNPVTPGNSAVITLNGTNTLSAGNYVVTITGNATSAATRSRDINFTINQGAAPTITSQPANTAICVGQNTSFTVAATSATTYQWQVSTNNGGTFTDITNGGIYSGATTTTLTITGAIASLHGYRYRAIASFTCGSSTSNSALLTINTPPALLFQPQPATVCEGSSALFAVAGAGTINSYQWQVSTNNGATYTDIPGATAASFTIPNTIVGQSSYLFRAIVTGPCGPLNSNPALLTVNAYPVINFNNLPKTVCISDPSFGLTANPGNGTWSGTGVQAGNFIPATAGVGAQTISYSVSNAGCSSSKSGIVQVNECQDRHRLLNAFQAVIIYPNPNDGHFNIKLNSDLYKKLGVRIYGDDGRLFKVLSFDGLSFGSTVAIDVPHLANGIYYIHINNTENGFIRRIDPIVISRN